jgi:hypothetical protein
MNFAADEGKHIGNVKNKGEITVHDGGSVYLIGANVENDGIITAPNGEVLLAAGRTVKLVDTTLPGVSIDVGGIAGKVTNIGRIIASAGTVGIGAALIDNSGTINASSVTKEGGRIFLRASQDLTTTSTSMINADGTVGGNVVLYADHSASIDGDVSALGNVDGNGGKGGYVDTSGKRILNVKYVPRVGPGGQWFIDPHDVEIVSDAVTEIGALGASVITANGDNAKIRASTITGQLNTGVSVTISTGTDGTQTGDITVSSAIIKNTGALATLTMDAAGSIVINDTVSSTGGSGMNLVLIAHNGGISQTAALAVGDLTASAGAAITLTNAGNQIGALTANNSAGDLAVTTSGGAIALNNISATNGNITINSTNNDIHLVGNLTANGTGKGIVLTANAGMLQSSGVISTGQLTANAGIDIDLQSVGNNVGSFTGTTPLGHISLNNTGNLSTFGHITVGAAKAVTLATTGNLTVGGLGIDAQTINLSAAAPSISVPVNIAINGQLAATGAVSLHTANGTISQTAAISATSLDVIAGAGITLGNGANVITGFSGSNGVSGNIVLNNSGTSLLTLGAIDNNNGGGITITHAGALSTTGTIFSTGTVAMTAAGALSVGSTVTAKQINLTTTGSADHTITTAAQMTATDSLGTGVILNSAGAVTLGNITTPNLTVVAGNGAVAQTTSTTLNVSNLADVTATGGIALDQTANMLNFVKGSNSGSGDIVIKTSSSVLHPFALTNTAAGGNITIEALQAAIIAASGNGVNGVISTNGVLTMTAGGSLSAYSALSGSTINLTAGQGNDIQLFGNLTSAGGTVSLTTDGAIIQSGGGIAANLLNAHASTGMTLNSSSNSVGAFVAQNATSGDIAFNDASSSGLLLNGTVSNAAVGGNVSIANTGNITGVPIHDGGGNVTNGTFANNKVTLTSTAGNVILAKITAANLDVRANAGLISQEVSNMDNLTISNTMTASAKNGIAITGHSNVTGLNHIANFSATNSTSGDITVYNAGAGNKLIAITNNGGNIFVHNVGAMETVGLISAPAGSVTLSTESPLTIGAGGINAGTGISLAAGNNLSVTDAMTINGAIRNGGAAASTNIAGNLVTMNASVFGPTPVYSSPNPVVFGASYALNPVTVTAPVTPIIPASTIDHDLVVTQTPPDTVVVTTPGTTTVTQTSSQTAGGSDGEFGGEKDDGKSGKTKSNKPLPICS